MSYVLCLLSSFISSFARAEELKDIRGPVSIPGEWLWLWVVLGCLAAVGAVAVVLSRLNRPRAAIGPALPIQSPWDRALESLAGLERESRVSIGEIKEFYFCLSVIVRDYIEARFEIRAPEMTTEEFLDKATSSSILNEEQKRFLRDFLGASDLVKFAKFVPTEADMVSALRLARTFVTETIPGVERQGNVDPRLNSNLEYQNSKQGSK
jgi:hypothetical protein